VPGRSLCDCIGANLEYDGVPVVALPHPSGVSRWLNAPANRARLDQALLLIGARLDALDGE
jgi:hypothetical protein